MNKQLGASKMAQHKRGSATKPGDLSSIPRTFDLGVSAAACAHLETYRQSKPKYTFKKCFKG